MSSPILGLDPGSDGGAVLLTAEGQLVAAWAWIERRTDKKPIWLLKNSQGQSEYVRKFAHLGARIACQILGEVPPKHLPYNLVVEGLFVGSNPAACLDLSFSAGLVAAPLAALAEGDIARPTAIVWREKVLFLKKADTYTAKQAAHAWAAKYYPHLGELLDITHICEAAAIAFFGLPATVQRQILEKRVA